MADFELSERCGDCDTRLVFVTADDSANDHGEPAITCPACLDLKRTGTVDPSDGDVIRFIHDGEEVQGRVVAVGHSGTIRVSGIGVVDIDPDQVIEILDDAGGTNVGDA